MSNNNYSNHIVKTLLKFHKKVLVVKIVTKNNEIVYPNKEFYDILLL